MIRSTLIAALAFLLLVATACDDTPGLVDVTQKKPLLSHFEIFPNTISFYPDEGVKDTSVIFELSVLADDILSSPPVVTVGSKLSSDIMATGTLEEYDEGAGRYSGNISVPFQTTTFGDYIFYVRSDLPDGSITNLVEGSVKVRGFATGKPEIQYTDHPDTVQIPASGNREFLIKAKVVHPNGQNNIRNVNLELIDGNNNQIGRFSMYDDGTNGDITPQDSIYTNGFSINSGNQPDNITIRIYAIDNFDAVSDTVTSHMAIIR